MCKTFTVLHSQALAVALAKTQRQKKSLSKMETSISWQQTRGSMYVCWAATPSFIMWEESLILAENNKIILSQML